MVLLKLILLERKIIVYSHQESTASAFILALCSLMPGLLAFGGSHLNSKKVDNYLKAQEMHGLPLQVYNSKTYLLPLFTLYDLNSLKELNGYTIGTTNKLLLELPQVKADAYVNIDEQTFSLHNKALEPVLKLTACEQNLVKGIVESIEKCDGYNWSCIESGVEQEFSGSNDFIRNEFGEYYRKFAVDLSVIELICGDRELAKKEENVEVNLNKLKQLYDKLHTENGMANNKSEVISATEEVKVSDKVTASTLTQEERKEEMPKERKEQILNQILQNYNLKFLKEWQFTINYRLWQLLHSSQLFSLSNFIGKCKELL
eukprot:TRINITY_DN13901_c0_g1_i1.p1 TRINITY_DN13901_c0_g1~~TRINITY_DN13901_c0_g1_i1.p1  ORF type:complete len:361 (-),score=90.90 TRINITY_DN13901_c0_g1_i1:673-1623(-)